MPLLYYCHSVLRHGTQGRLSSRAYNLLIQVFPFRVCLFYQLHLPAPFPFLYLPLTLICIFTVCICLKIHQCMYAIFTGESFNQIIFVFIDTVYQVSGGTYIEGSIASAGKNINVVVAYSVSGFLPRSRSRFSTGQVSTGT